MERKTWIFTFGSGQAGYKTAQPIRASTSYNARNAMFETYGTKWSFQYTEEEFVKSQKEMMMKFGIPPDILLDVIEAD